MQYMITGKNIVVTDGLKSAVKSKIGFTPIVYVVELGFLPRSEKKSKRVIDERFD